MAQASLRKEATTETNRDPSYSALPRLSVASPPRPRSSRRSANSKRGAANPAEPLPLGPVAADGVEGFGNFMYSLSCTFWLSMVFGGFVTPKGGHTANNFWQGLFLLAMLVCGSVCFINCFVMDPPYHNFAADVMVSFVHIPGFYSIFFWSRVFKDTDSPVWYVIMDGKEQMATLKRAVQLMGPFLFPAQIATVLLVYAGYSVPTQKFINEDENANMLSVLHNWSMWIVIPPVVSCVVANAAFFAFFVFAMYLQVDGVLQLMKIRENKLLSCSRDSMLSVMSQISHTSSEMQGTQSRSDMQGTQSLLSVPMAEIPEESQAPAELADFDYEGFMEVLADDVFNMQDIIDDVCKLWSPLVVLFLCVAFAEILAVMYDFILVYGHVNTFEMTTWVYCIDTFLVVSGIGIVTGFLAMGAVLTQRMDELCVDSVSVMRAGAVPISKAASVYYYLQTGGRKTGLGFKIYGRRIAWSHVFGFLSGVLTVVGFIMSSMSGGSTAPAHTHRYTRAMEAKPRPINHSNR